MRGWPALLAVAVALMAMAPAATAQVFAEPAATDVTLRPGQPSTVQVLLTNPTARTYFALASPGPNHTRYVEIEPDRFQVGPDESVPVNVTLYVPADAESDSGVAEVVFVIIDRQTGDSFERRATVAFLVEREELLLGVLSNPLPPPFHSGWGIFAAEVAAWFVLSFVASSAAGFLLSRLFWRSSRDSRRKMATMVQVPVWYLILVLGLSHSWRLVPRTPIVAILDRLNTAAAIVVAAYLLYRIIKAALAYYSENVAGRTSTRVDDLLIPVLEKVGAVVVVTGAAVFVFQSLGVDLSFLVAGGLVVGLVISMAAQDTLSNFFSGIFILVDQPFREGDELMLETGEICRVDRIGLRSTRLYHFQHNQLMIVPNNELATKRVVNMSYPDPLYRISLPVGVAYGSDLRKVQRILLETVKQHDEVVVDEQLEPVVWIRGFGDSSIDFEVRAYVPSTRRRNPVSSELRVAIKEAFDREGIEIPFPQRDLWFKNAGASPPYAPDAT